MKLFLKESIPFEDIEITANSDEFHFHDSIQSVVDELWQQRLTVAQQAGQKIWDGLNYYLQDFEYKDGKLKLILGKIRFRNMTMLKFFPQDKIYLLEKVEHTGGMFVAGILKTTDNYYIFPRRQQIDIIHKQGGVITTVGGVLSSDEVTVDSFSDIWRQMLIEIDEELGIKENLIASKEFIGFMTTVKHGNIGFLFYVTLSITHTEVCALFAQSNDGEMSEVVCIHSDDVYDFLTKEGVERDGSYARNLGQYRDMLVYNGKI